MMDISGFSSRNAGTTENMPRRWDSADSLPSLSQLQMLYEEALEEENAPEPEPVREEENPAPAVTSGQPVLLADIPSLEQLHSLRDWEEQALSRRPQPVAADRGAYNRRASSPVVRRSAAAAPSRPKPVANSVRVAAKPKAAPAQQKTAAPAKPAPKASAAANTASDLPSMEYLRSLRDRMDTAECEAEETAPAREFVSERFPSGIPSLAQLKGLREEVSIAREEKQEQIVVRRQSPAAPVQQPTPAAETPCQTSDRPSRLSEIPSLEQLKALLAEEREFGNLAFHEGVRQVKESILNDSMPTAKEEAAAPQTPPPAQQRMAAEPRSGILEKVHYIPYEEFVPGKEFENVAEFYGRRPKMFREPIKKIERSAETKDGNIYFNEFSKQEPALNTEEPTPSKRRKEKRARKKKQKNEDFSGSVLEELPSTQQLNKSKPKYGHSTDVKGKKKPSNKQLAMERRRLRYKHDLYRVLRSTIFTLITVSAVAVLIAVLLLPVLRIYGTSMTPTLNESDIVLSVKGSKFETGDVIAFYYNNKILVKRVIAQAGDWVDITKDGTVVINGEVLVEPYVKNKAFGECDIELPYQVPEDRVFVMGDYRDVSIDSRNTTIGPIAEEQIVGKIIYRIWPMNEMGEVE